ncbi:hypothetical protein [Heliothis virescens ascovirus 3h]|uniref:Uncharacterized protein n=1 Tax=Heliothis virescens ascovirus 3h TaxID=1268039 RepID=A0A2K8ESA2_9VIRU|nr:hypothetical protein [Heliothis virescens ascovirus 3h]
MKSGTFLITLAALFCCCHAETCGQSKWKIPETATSSCPSAAPKDWGEPPVQLCGVHRQARCQRGGFRHERHHESASVAWLRGMRTIRCSSRFTTAEVPRTRDTSQTPC